MEKEIIETYAFNPEDYYDGRRKSDGKTFRDEVKVFERDFHQRHSGDYALNLYATPPCACSKNRAARLLS